MTTVSGCESWTVAGDALVPIPEVDEYLSSWSAVGRSPRTVEALGAIEGIADAALSPSKVAGGVVANRPGVERKTVTAAGDAVTALGHGAAGLLDPTTRGRGFGLFGLVDGVGDLLSSVIVGVLFTRASPAWGFIHAPVLSAAATAVLLGERLGSSP